MSTSEKRQINKCIRRNPFHCFCTIAFLSFFAFGLQGNDIAEKEGDLLLMPNDTAKVNTLVKLGKHYCSKENDKALFYLEQAVKLSNDLNYNLGLAESHIWLGRTYYYKDEYVNSEFHLNYATDVLKHGENNKLLAISHMFLGALNDVNGDYIRAVDNHLKAIELADLIKDKEIVANGYHSLGMIHQKLNNHDTALEYLRTSLGIYRSLGIKPGIANVRIGIGDIFRAKGDFQNALENYNEAHSIRREIGYPRHIASSEYTLGCIYIDMEIYDRAITILPNAIRTFTELEESYGICISTIKLAQAYNYAGQKELAEMHASEALEIAENLNNDELMSMCYEILASMAQYNEDYSEAYRYLSLFNGYNEILAQKKKDRIIKETEARFQVNRMRNDVESLKARSTIQKRNLIILTAFIGALMVFLALTLLIFRLRMQAMKRKRALLEQDLIIREQRETLAEKEKLLLEKQLETHNRVLAAKTIEMIRMNEILLGIMTRLHDIDFESTHKEDFKRTINKIAKEIELNNQNDIWNEFDTIFRNIHSDYYEKLLSINPDLTPSEIKIASLLKLNLNTKEIAAITYKSEAGIKSTRYRLRKKLNIDSEDQMVPFLMQL